MVFGIIHSLKLKPAASEESAPMPPLSLCFPLPNREGGIGVETCSTKPDSCRSIYSLQQSFARRHRTIYTGSICIVSVIILRQLISWYQNHNVLPWSIVTRFLKGTVDWRNLPLDLVGEIGKRMVNRLDIASLQCVCKGWRSSLPSPTRFPLCLPMPPNCDPTLCDMPYAISELTIYRGQYGRVFMQVDQGEMFLLGAYMSYKGDTAKFQRASILRSSPKFKYSDLYFFAKAYYPCMALDSPKIRRKRLCKEFPRKLVLISSSNAYGVNPNYARLSDLSVVAHLSGEGEMKGRLALLRLGGSPENWVWDTNFCSQVYVNITTYKGQLCTLDRWGRLSLMDYNSLQMTQLCAPLSFPPLMLQKSLFEARGELYLVNFRMSTKYPVLAYKLSLRLQKWLRVEGMCKGFGVVGHFLL